MQYKYNISPQHNIRTQIQYKYNNIIEASRSRSDTRHSVGLLWTSDQPVAETAT
jgi:hypothetical protein